jgi:hypothetical protein
MIAKAKADPLDIPPERQLYSTGKASELLQISPHALRGEMSRLGLRFAESQNGVPFLDGRALDSLMAARRESKSQA